MEWASFPPGPVSELGFGGPDSIDPGFTPQSPTNAPKKRVRQPTGSREATQLIEDHSSRMVDLQLRRQIEEEDEVKNVDTNKKLPRYVHFMIDIFPFFFMFISSGTAVPKASYNHSLIEQKRMC